MTCAHSPQADAVRTASSAEQARRRLVDNTLQLTDGTPLAAGPYERMLLDQFVRGELTIDQVLAYLAEADQG